MRAFVRWIALWVGLTLLLFAGATAGWLAYDIMRPGPLADTKRVLLERGTNLQAIADRLKQEGVVRSSRLFVWTARLMGEQHGLQAGEYNVAPRASLTSVLQQLRRGETVRYSVTVPEGLTVKQIWQLLEETPYLQRREKEREKGSKEESKRGSKEGRKIASLPQEGSLLPDTYAYRRGESPAKIIERMHRAMEKYVSRAWQKEGVSPLARRFLKSERDVLIFASLVERETGKASERARIAGVFYNRLKRGMKLQTDPTLVYWESKKWGVLGRGLRRSELLRDHPYNTYMRTGLPPSPIANPGRLSIEATLHPAETADLYFVADGAGGHRFGKTLVEHTRNVALWRTIEAKRRRSRR